MEYRPELLEEIRTAKTISEATARKEEEPEGFNYFKSEKYYNYLLEKAKYYNSLSGLLKFYDCDICKNKGVVEYITEDWEESLKTCTCMKARACYQAMNRSGITEDMLRRFTFKSFSQQQEWQTKMLAISARYAKSDLTGWLLLSGQSGTGKTHLCTAVSRYLLETGHEVRYVLWHDVARRLQALKYKLDDYEAYIKDICGAEVLYIDDMFKADKSTGPAFEIINNRYLSRKPTIISSELYLSDMKLMDEAMGSRIAEMSKDFCVQIRNEADRNFRNRENKNNVNSENNLQ